MPGEDEDLDEDAMEELQAIIEADYEVRVRSACSSLDMQAAVCRRRLCIAMLSVCIESRPACLPDHPRAC